MSNTPPLLAFDRVEREGATILRIKTSLAEATISVFGGQILAWKPAHTARDVLWVSPLASLDGPRAIRGGVPLCWPWFGAHAGSALLPAHGLARLARWRFDHASLLPDGSVDLRLSLPALSPPPGSTHDEIAGGLRLLQTVRIGETLSVSLTTRNDGDVERRYTEGLHTYFQVDDVERIRVEGLDGCAYRDLTSGNVLRTQDGSVSFDGETARLFVGTENVCEIVDPGLDRRIRVAKSGSRSTAVWNPGATVAGRMADLGDTAWRHMVCVETANALDDVIVLPPGEQRTMTAHYSVAPLT